MSRAETGEAEERAGLIDAPTDNIEAPEPAQDNESDVMQDSAPRIPRWRRRCAPEDGTVPKFEFVSTRLLLFVYATVFVLFVVGIGMRIFAPYGNYESWKVRDDLGAVLFRVRI